LLVTSALNFALVMQYFDFTLLSMILVSITTVISPNVVLQLTFAVLGHHVNTNRKFLDQLNSVIRALSPPKHHNCVCVIQLLQVKNPRGFMVWYLKSRVFLEAVINLSVGESDKFIDKVIKALHEGDPTRPIYQIVDEHTPRAFRSLERLMLDFLQPTSVQLLGSLNECLRKYFYSSNTTAAASVTSFPPTILRNSQSAYDSSDDGSPRLARRLPHDTLPATTSTPAVAAVDVESLDGSSPSSASPEVPFPEEADDISTAQPVPSSGGGVAATALCLIEYIAVVERSWWKPSIVPQSLRTFGNTTSDVLGILKVGNCNEYIFCPIIVLPVSLSGSEVSFPKVAIHLSDAKGKTLDVRELDQHNLILKDFATTPKPSSAIKGSVFRNAGYSVRVRQYFLQIACDTSAGVDVLWWYMNDDGRLLSLPFV
jgi:hypothetical protein